jgi:hypothetical protein
MEKHASRSIPPDAAREQLRAGRQAHDASVRRALTPAGLILAVGFFCGALTLAPAHKEPGHVVTIIAVVWFVAELLRMSAHNQWRALSALPQPKWTLAETTLICLALLVGGVVGPHLLASRSNSALLSCGLATAVMITVAGCLFAANASYRHRTALAWQQ